VIRFAFPDAKLAELVSSMSKYYRIALNKGDNVIKVCQEIEMAEEYLKIQRFAYISHFEFSVDVDKSIMEHMILKHLLQPVVENAFLHGISGIESGGRIAITGKRAEGKIVFEVIDNGIGMEQEKIDRILNGENISMYGGYGLQNIRSKMEAYYGEGYGLAIRSRVNEGTTVIITIPSE